MNRVALLEKLQQEVLVGFGEHTVNPKLVRLAPPAKSDKGDFALGCFPFSKQFKTKPAKIAETIAATYTAAKPENSLIQSVTADGPYLNIVLSSRAITNAALGEYWLRTEAPAKEHVVIEFSSPNTNKPQHLGHIRNNVLGASVSNILKWTGRKVTKYNLINDRGIHICKSMLAYKLFGEGETPESSGLKPDHLVGKYYVLFETKYVAEYKAWLESDEGKARLESWKMEKAGITLAAKLERERKKTEKIKDEKKREKKLAAVSTVDEMFPKVYKDTYFNNESIIGGQAREYLRKWEEGDTEVRALWTKMNDWVFTGFKVTYKSLGIEFDQIDLESQTYILGKDIVQKGFTDGIFEKLENGAIACDLKKIGLKEGKKVLLRGDGTSVYMTQDLGTAIQRYEKNDSPKRMIYIVGDEQNDHFKKLFGIVGVIKPEMKGVPFHLSYGMVNLPTGKMKSREGTVVDADDLIQQTTDLAVKETKERWPGLTEEEAKERARVIALGAIKFFILSFSPQTTMMFDPKKSLEFTGKTGPYLLYTYARTRTLLTKANLSEAEITWEPELFDNFECTKLEREVMKKLLAFSDAIDNASNNYDPSKVCLGAYHICQAFSSMYTDKANHPIVSCEDKNLRKIRFMLVIGVGKALRRALDLLNIETLEKM